MYLWKYQDIELPEEKDDELYHKARHINYGSELQKETILDVNLLHTVGSNLVTSIIT